MRWFVFLIITGTAIPVGYASMAEVLHFPDREFCSEPTDASGNAVTQCETLGVAGYDVPFCRPLPGFAENYVVAEWVGSTWWLIDCSDGRRVEILIRDIANGIELKNEMLSYRESLLDSGAKPKISEITEHMASIGSKFEFQSEILSPEQTKRFCSYAVVQEDPCLSGADAEDN